MKMELKYNVDFSKMLKHIKVQKLDLQLNTEVGKKIVESSKRFIESGKVMPPLKQSTIDWRQRQGFSGDKPLFMTGKMSKSLTATPKGIRSTAYNKKGKPYARYHYHGGYETTPNGNPPERKFITAKSRGVHLTSSRAADKIYKEFQDRLVKLLSKSIRKRK